MRKRLSLTLSVAVIISLTITWGLYNSATAATVVDTITFSPAGASEGLISNGGFLVDTLEWPSDHLLWRHDFPFDPMTERITRATLSLELEDDACDPWYQPLEFGVLVPEDYTWDLWEVKEESRSYLLEESYLEDGEFTVMLLSVLGDFVLKESKLTLTVVPIPGSFWLLGSAALGLVVIKRRRSA